MTFSTTLSGGMFRRERVFARFWFRTEKNVRARGSVGPAIVGRNARLRAYSADALRDLARSLQTRQRGIARCGRNDLRGCRK
jgi:hypothetical protein